LHGKVLYGIGKRCKEKNIPVIAICGCLGNGYEALYEHGITKFYATVDNDLSEKEILANANDNFMKAAVRMFEDIKNGNIS
ncbi:MAG: glycerate kinase, partial [Solobacterium sp.]|nr:glycerate kinase [Solobacterium sp.]